MAVRSKALAQFALVSPTAGVAIYTVPSGETAIVKRIIFHPMSATTNCTVYIGRVGISTTSNLLWRATVNIGVPVELETWAVFPAGFVIWAAAVGNSVTRVSLYGAELEGAAD